MTQEDSKKRELTTLDIAIIVISFLGFVGTVVNVCFAVIDHLNLNELKKRM